ncbi:MAG: hypothetical protein NE330_18445 [Lentisphaeraceae bacterium]|nr:hypothetical protein [Lentisphaeraceae bacterium]
MYFSNIINIPLWDKVKWSGMIMREYEGGIFLGPVFNDEEAARGIFNEWITNYGDDDLNNEIRLSIIEDDSPGCHDYWVHVSANLDNKIKEGKLSETSRLVSMSRFHKMTPSSSVNLLDFKKNFSKAQNFSFLPAILEGAGARPLFDLAIRKKDLIFRKKSEIRINDRTDIDVIVLNRELKSESEDESPIDSHDDLTAAEITDILAAFESRLATGDFGDNFDPIIIDRLFTLERDSEGIVIPETVDPMLLAIAHIQAEEQWYKDCQSISLSYIQDEYVKLLQYLLKPFLDLKENTGRDNATVARFISSKDEFVKNFQNQAPEIAKAINGFWETFGSILTYHIRNLKGTKCVFGGDSFPGLDSDLFNTATVYLDTLIIPDPLQNAVNDELGMKSSELLYLFIKQGLTALGYAEFTNITGLNQPMVIFSPAKRWNLKQFKNAWDLIHKESEKDFIHHCSQTFNYSFIDIKDTETFFQYSKTKENLVSTIKDPKYLLIDANYEVNPYIQINRATVNIKDFMTEDFIETIDFSWDDEVRTQLFGKWMQLNSCLFHCELYGGVPIIDAPTPWQYYQWKLEFDNEFDGTNEAVEKTFVSHIFHSGLLDVSFVENITAESIIELKKNGFLAELRTLIRESISDIEISKAESIDGMADNISAKLNELMDSHKEELEKLQKEGITFSVKSTVSIGTKIAAVVSTCTGNPTLGIISYLAGEVGLPTMKDMLKDGKDLKNKSSLLKKNPIGFFVDSDKRE